MRRLAILAAALLPLAVPAAATAGAAPFVIAETGQGFGSLQQAVDAIGARTGTIRIAAGRYTQCAVQTAGQVAFVAERPGSVMFDGTVCEQKAVLVLRGQSSRVDGIVFEHLFVPDGNGAGIRFETGKLDVENAMFVDSQCGIITAIDPNGEVRVDHSTFAGLGKDPTGHGAHSIYIGRMAAVTVTNSRFERGTGGHYLKTRARRITALDNSFDDTRGHNTNYMIDISNGATGRVAGNTFVQGPDKENDSTMITVAPEGAQLNPAGLVIEGNRAMMAPGAHGNPALVGLWTGEPIIIRNNVIAPGMAMSQRH